MLQTAVTVILILSPVLAVQETHHLVEIDNEGRKIPMDVTYDSDKNTVHVAVGDISKYKDSIQTVNLHDYKTGYGVLKDIDNKICLLALAPFPKASPEKYGVGVTSEIHYHKLDINTVKMTHDMVMNTAGPNIASFCSDYSTFSVTATPIEKQKRDSEVEETKAMWCVFSKCISDAQAYQRLIDGVFG